MTIDDANFGQKWKKGPGLSQPVMASLGVIELRYLLLPQVVIRVQFISTLHNITRTWENLWTVVAMPCTTETNGNCLSYNTMM